MHSVVNPKTQSDLAAYLGSQNLFQFLNACQGQTVWILGAGASRPDRPVWSELRSTIVSNSLNLSGYPTTPSPSAFLRLFVEEERPTDSLGLAKLLHTPESFRRLCYEQNLLRPDLPLCGYPQYLFFDLVDPIQPILTTNQDGLVHYLARPHPTVCLHGCVYDFAPILSGGCNRNRRELAVELMKIRTESVDLLGFDPLPNRSLFTPWDELDEGRIRVVERALAFFTQAKCVVSVGYSFSDLHINQLLALVGSNLESVIVVGPQARRHAPMLESIIRRRNVFALPLFWDDLATSILTVCQRDGFVLSATTQELRDRILVELRRRTNKFPMKTELRDSSY